MDKISDLKQIVIKTLDLNKAQDIVSHRAFVFKINANNILSFIYVQSFYDDFF